MGKSIVLNKNRKNGGKIMTNTLKKNAVMILAAALAAVLLLAVVFAPVSLADLSLIHISEPTRRS